jgi:hypothetical protein
MLQEGKISFSEGGGGVNKYNFRIKIYTSDIFKGIVPRQATLIPNRYRILKAKNG